MAERWEQSRAAAWRERVGWLVGCNFSPSTAGNQLEMWQAATFDPTTIDRELGWASGLGMNAVRVYLHDLLWVDDADGFLARVDQVLSIADGHGIGMIPVLFDGVWHPRPTLGPQPEPRPKLHNSTWVQRPGREILDDPARWDALRPYVDGVLQRFGGDERVLAWDLFNEPDQIDIDTLRSGSRDAKAASAADLLEQVFAWARAADPDQPLTAGIWEYDEVHLPVDNRINRVMASHSDVISFHCYEPERELRAVIAGLGDHGRPLLCTEWLARTAGSTAELLGVFAEQGVAAINWGLVDGRTQTRFPWRSWTEDVGDDEPWFHELLHADGTPYDESEAELFRSLTSRG